MSNNHDLPLAVLADIDQLAHDANQAAAERDRAREERDTAQLVADYYRLLIERMERAWMSWLECGDSSTAFEALIAMSEPLDGGHWRAEEVSGAGM